MALEVTIHKEITEYEAKVIAGMTLRQLISLSVAVVVSVSIGVLNYFFLHLSVDDISWVLIGVGIPIFGFGWFKPDGLPFEKYLMMRRRYSAMSAHIPYEVTEKKKEGDVVVEDKKEAKKRRENGN